MQKPMYKIEQKLIHGQLVNVKVYPPRYVQYDRRWASLPPPALNIDTVDDNIDGDPLAVDKALQVLAGGKLTCY